MTELKKLLGKKIKEIRKKRNLTQEQLAELIDIEIPSMSNIETGKFAPSIETMQKLARELRVKPYELYLFDDVSYEEKLSEMTRVMASNEKLTNKMYKFFQAVLFEV